MFDNLYKCWVELFFKFEENKKDSGYLILKSSVALKLLNELYLKFIADKQSNVLPIESIPIEKKNRYWSIAKVYYEEKEKAIECSKACYVLDLITSNN